MLISTDQDIKLTAVTPNSSNKLFFKISTPEIGAEYLDQRKEDWPKYSQPTEQVYRHSSKT